MRHNNNNPPLDLVLRGRQAGRSHELVEADAATSPGADVEQGDVVPPVPAGAAEWDELLVPDYQADLQRDSRYDKPTRKVAFQLQPTIWWTGQATIHQSMRDIKTNFSAEIHIKTLWWDGRGRLVGGKCTERIYYMWNNDVADASSLMPQSL